MITFTDALHLWLAKVALDLVSALVGLLLVVLVLLIVGRR